MTMLRFIISILTLWIAEAFKLSSFPTRCPNLLGTTKCGLRIEHVRGNLAGPSPPPPQSVAMNLLLANGEPMKNEVLEPAVSVLNLGSTVLLAAITFGAAYLTYADWQGKRDAKKQETFVATTGELPETAINKATEGEEDEGNRRYRRMAKKEKQNAEKE